MDHFWIALMFFILGYIIGNCRNKVIEGHGNHTNPEYSHGRRGIHTREDCDTWNHNHPHKLLHCIGPHRYTPARRIHGRRSGQRSGQRSGRRSGRRRRGGH